MRPALRIPRIGSLVSAALSTSVLSRDTLLAIQRSAGNAAATAAVRGTATVQRDLDSDIIDALVLENYPRAVVLLDKLSDADLATTLGQASPERLRGLKRAARAARATRVAQVVGRLQLRAGSLVETDEGDTIRAPVTLFQSGVVISKDVHFVKAGRFRRSDDFARMKNLVMEAIRLKLTNRFKLKIESPAGSPQSGDGEYTIRVQIIDNNSASYPMVLHGQRHGRWRQFGPG